MCCANRRSVLGVFGVALVALGLGFAGCTPAPDPWTNAKQGQKHILVTFPPLYGLTHAIAGEDAYVLCFLTTEEPHDYKLNPQDAIKARRADLIIYNSLTLDDTFVEKLIVGKKIATLSAKEAIPKDKILANKDEDDDKKDAKHDHKKDGHHHHGGNDPHVWLSPERAMEIADAISRKLQEIDSSHADGYKKRSLALRADLQKLWDDGKSLLKGKENKKIVSMHDSMRYFAQAFDIDVIAVIEELPGQDPDAKKLADLVKRCKEKDVRVITYEPQYTKAQPELLQKQLKNRGIDIQLIEFDPIETAPLGKDGVNPDPDYYLKKMRANLEALAKALP